jgi:MscS family membrane protein
VLLYFFLEVPDWAAELRQREDVLLRIIECADRLGVEFAFPTRTLHIAGADGPAPDTG